MGGAPDAPQYPPVGAHVDYYLAAEPAGPVTLEILDAAGTVIRGFSSEVPTGSGSAAGQGMGRPGRPRPAPSRVEKTRGMHRFRWDLRYPGVAGGGRGGDGPMAVPGRYHVRLRVGGWSATQPFEVRIDPRVAADGVTQADLVEQLDLLVKVRDAVAEARRLAEQVREARERAAGDPDRARTLGAIHDRLVTSGGSYPQPMLIDQFANIFRMLGQADQKPGRDAWTRYEDLVKDLEAIKAAIPR